MPICGDAAKDAPLFLVCFHQPLVLIVGGQDRRTELLRWPEWHGLYRSRRQGLPPGLLPFHSTPIPCLHSTDASPPAFPQDSLDALSHKQIVVPRRNLGDVLYHHVQMLRSNIPCPCVSLAHIYNSICTFSLLGAVLGGLVQSQVGYFKTVNSIDYNATLTPLSEKGGCFSRPLLLGHPHN